MAPIRLSIAFELLSLVGLGAQTPQGSTLDVACKDAGAEYGRALARAEAAYGPDDARVSNLLNNYALFEKRRGNYGAAERLLNRALAIRKRISGPAHAETATILNNLGQLARLRGDRARAGALFRDAIRVWENATGPERAGMASALTNLGALLAEQKKYRESERFYRRALSIDEACYGGDHPNAGRDLNNLGVLYCMAGRYGEAEPLLVRALEIQKKTPYPSLEAAKVLRNLAEARSRLGAAREAESLYREALAIWDASAETDNPEALPAIDGLAALLRASARQAEAEKISLRGMRIRVKQAVSAEQGL